MSMTGACNCEAIKVTIKNPGQVGYCHCSSCRAQSGARGSYVMTLPDSDFEVSGKPKAWKDTKTDSGTPLDRWFCGDCGSPIMSVTPLMPGKAFVKMGLFAKIPAPVVEVYTRNRDEWEPVVPNTAQIAGAPGGK